MQGAEDLLGDQPLRPREHLQTDSLDMDGL
jgi:hypothetical protein